MNAFAESRIIARKGRATASTALFFFVVVSMPIRSSQAAEPEHFINGKEYDHAYVEDRIDEQPNEDGSLPLRRGLYGLPTFQELDEESQKRLIEESENLLIVGLKEPGVGRGEWRGKSLVRADLATTLREQVLKIDGVADASSIHAEMPSLLGESLPIMVVRIDSYEAFRRLVEANTVEGFVDYVEVLRFMDNTSVSGCSGWAEWKDPQRQRQQNGTTGSQLGGGAGDLIPWVYYPLGIVDAWRREQLPGQSYPVAITDTGMSTEQMQYYTYFPHWRGVSALIEDARELPSWLKDSDDTCGHGTKMAGIVAAPKDGRSIVGVAWGTKAIVQKIGNGVVKDSEWPLLSDFVDACNGLYGAARNGAKVIAMAWGAEPWIASWMPNTLNACISTVYAMKNPEIVMVAAAGTKVGFPVYPCVSEKVTCVTAVEHEDNGYRKMGWGTVAYGSEVDYATIVGDDSDLGAIPTMGRVGNAAEDDVSHLGGSSSSTALMTGMISIVRSAAEQKNWRTTRRDVDSILESSSSLNNISGIALGNSGRSTDIGAGIPDTYVAAGGMRNGMASILGDTIAPPFSTRSLTAAPGGLLGGRYSYLWSTGETTNSIVITVPAAGSATYWVDIKDLDEINALAIRATHQINSGAYHQRGLYSKLFVAHWDEPVWPTGHSQDVTINAGKTMKLGCKVVAVGGKSLRKTSNGIWVERDPGVAIWNNKSDYGFTVSRPPGKSQNDLAAQVHVWHEAYVGVAVRVYYLVDEPDGVDCSVPNDTQDVYW